MTFTFKIKIEGSLKPPIWRKVKVPAKISFDDFHMVIQAVFGWTNSHMYLFSEKGYGSFPSLRYDYNDDIQDGFEFEDPETYPYGGNHYDSSKIVLKDYFGSFKQRMIYIYDFGDDWKHSIVLTDVTDELVLRPVCLGGKSRGPVEDCGGINGYYYMLNIISDKEHPEYNDWREWLDMEEGEEWDETAFDLEDTNRYLHAVWDAWQKKLKS